jgi:hypothetical protein
MILATVAQKFRLRLVANHHVEPLASITLRPRYGCASHRSAAVQATLATVQWRAPSVAISLGTCPGARADLGRLDPIRNDPASVPRLPGLTLSGSARHAGWNRG